jgi:hypothetical protein
MADVVIDGVPLKTQPISYFPISDEHLKMLTPADHDIFVKFNDKISGYVLQKPVDAEKGIDPLWTLVSGDVIRIPIFRYDLSTLDPDFLATAAMQMLAAVGRLEDEERIINVRQRIFLRRTVPETNHLYVGVFIRLL